MLEHCYFHIVEARKLIVIWHLRASRLSIVRYVYTALGTQYRHQSWCPLSYGADKKHHITIS
ncbi:hypothetical protein M413DRAFT_115041 [Hebeloma cylindrosporum]|uniref:Uncharacterized protein n=1 Tax=Hebeloma cylindrosporum TaxID=76867 RepID=A0A0C2Z992_HEBCY|nr:hypothetical protein M413DRAFT_115041 [Hebeloma cylindrosporum h7]